MLTVSCFWLLYVIILSQLIIKLTSAGWWDAGNMHIASLRELFLTTQLQLLHFQKKNENRLPWWTGEGTARPQNPLRTKLLLRCQYSAYNVVITNLHIIMVKLTASDPLPRLCPWTNWGTSNPKPHEFYPLEIFPTIGYDMIYYVRSKSDRPA